jgi:hypothetical protein
MLESPAYQTLSLSAHRVIARIRLEFCHHGGTDNGSLPVTHRDFHQYGIHWDAISPAIREAEALGFIRITEHGIPSNAEFRKPNLFALTHLAVNEAAPTNDWEKIRSLEQASQLAAASRKQLPRHRKFPKKRPEKTFLRSGNRSGLAPETGSQTANSPLRKPEHCATPETGALYISTHGEHARRDPALPFWAVTLLPPGAASLVVVADFYAQFAAMKDANEILIALNLIADCEEKTAAAKGRAAR